MLKAKSEVEEYEVGDIVRYKISYGAHEPPWALCIILEKEEPFKIANFYSRMYKVLNLKDNHIDYFVYP